MDASRIAAVLEAFGAAITRRRGAGLAAAAVLAAISGASAKKPKPPARPCRKANKPCSKVNRCCKGLTCRKRRCIRVCKTACSRFTPLCCNGRCSAGVWSAGTPLGSGPGAAANQFFRPANSALSEDGATLFVADGDNYRVSVWTKSGASWTAQTPFGTGFGTGPTEFNSPMAAALAPGDPYVYVADTNNDRVSIWTRPVSGGAPAAPAATFGATGAGLGQFSRPSGIAFSANGLTAWVSDTFNSRVSVWTRADAASTAWTNQTVFGSYGTGPGQFDNPIGVAVTPDGLTVLVTDLGNDRVCVWVNTGGSWSPQTSFGTAGAGAGNLEQPWSIALSPDGLVAWVAEYGNNRVSVWTRPNAATAAWAWQTSFGSGPGSAPNQLDAVTGVSVSRDGLSAYVTDFNNNRITVWTRACGS